MKFVQNIHKYVLKYLNLFQFFYVSAERVGTLEVNPAADLEQMRGLIQNMIKESQAYSNLVDWWFVDCKPFECFQLHFNFMIFSTTFHLISFRQLAQRSGSSE